MKIKKICQQCGKEFEVEPYPRSGGKTRITCSKECRYKLPYLRRTGKYINCIICGRKFYIPINRLKIGARYCSLKCKGVGMRGKPSWNKTCSDELNYIAALIYEHRSLKKVSEITGRTVHSLSSLNHSRLRIPCKHGKRIRSFTVAEDEYAKDFLIKNPDLYTLAATVAKQWGIDYTVGLYRYVKHRNCKVWKIPLKKLRVKMGLNKTVFPRGLIPWNKGKTKDNCPSLNLISQKIKISSKRFWATGPSEIVDRMRKNAIRNMVVGGEKTRFKKGIIPWSLGKKFPERSGENNPRWKRQVRICAFCGESFQPKTANPKITHCDNACGAFHWRHGNLNEDELAKKYKKALILNSKIRRYLNV